MPREVISPLDDHALIVLGQSNADDVLSTSIASYCRLEGVIGGLFFRANHVGQPLSEWFGGGSSAFTVGPRKLYAQDLFPQYSNDLQGDYDALDDNEIDPFRTSPLSLDIATYVNQIKFVTFVWFQGEADTGLQTNYSTWHDRMLAMIAQIRSDFGNDILVRFILCKPHDTDVVDYTGYQAIHDAIDLLASNDVNIRAVDTTNFLRDDTLHVNASERLILARTITDEILTLTQ